MAITQLNLASKRVTHAVEPIAAVIAETAAQAEDVAEQVAIEITAGTPVVNFDQAFAHGAPLVHEAAANNTVIDAKLKTDDVERGFASAQEIIKFSFESRLRSAMPLEARGAVAAFDPAIGRIRLTCSTQSPHVMRTRIADVLRIPESEFHVLAPDLGGGFGQKTALIAGISARNLGGAALPPRHRVD